MRLWWNYHSDGSIGGVVGRSCSLFAIGIAVVGSSILAYFGTLSIFYDSSSSDKLGHLFSCPAPALMLDKTFFEANGDYCEVTAYNWNMESLSMIKTKGKSGRGYECILPSFEVRPVDLYEMLPAIAASQPIKCRVNRRCSFVKYCAEGSNGDLVACPRGVEEAFESATLHAKSMFVSLDPNAGAGFYLPWDSYGTVSFRQYCDSAYKIKPGKVIAARGIVGAFVILLLLWIVFDLSITMLVVRRNIRAMKTFSESLDLRSSGQKAAVSHTRLIEHTVGVSSILDRSNTSSSRGGSTIGREGMITRIVRDDLKNSGVSTPTTPSYKVAVCRDPFRAFESLHWRVKVMAYLGMRASSAFRRRSSVVSIFFEVISTGVVMAFFLSWCFLAVAPSDLLEDSFSVSDVLRRNYSSVWRAASTWMILPFLLLDELLELLLVFVSASVVRFTGDTTSVFARIAAKRALSQTTLPEYDSDELRLDGTTSSVSSADCKVVSESLIPDSVIAVICIDQVRLMRGCREPDSVFIENVRSVVSVVGIDRTFVLQFGPELVPSDDSLLLLQDHVSPGIQYVYLPEPDKATAVYWFSKYHVPLVQLHRGPEVSPYPISHLLVVDHTVRLPWNLTIPLDMVDPAEGVGLVCIGTKFSGRFDEQDYKTETLHAQFLSDRSSLGDAEISLRSGVCLWDRSALDVAAMNNTGDFVDMGAETVLRSRKVKFIQNAFVENFGVTNSASCMHGFAQKLYTVYCRRKRLILRDLLNVFAPTVWMDLARLAAKPISIVHVLNFLLDFIRWPVLISSLIRDPIGLGFVVALFWVILWIKGLVLALLGKGNTSGGFLVLVAAPLMYTVLNLLILRPLAVVASIFWTLRDRPGMTIENREDQEGSIPPCLPYPDAPWFSVWDRPVMTKLDIEHLS